MKKSLALQSLKGLASIVVLLGHVIGFSTIDSLHKLHDSLPGMFIDGQCAVMLFFALTGFFYYKSEKQPQKFINTYRGG